MKAVLDNKGFSLVEVMVGVTLLTIGMLAVGSMIMRSGENSRFSAQSRAGDAIALELMETIRAEATHMTMDNMRIFQLQKLYPGSTTRYEYQDDSPTNVSLQTSGMTQYFEHLGKGEGFIYKWRVEDQKDAGWPPQVLKLEVTVGWYNCGSGSNDPTTCRYTSKVTSYVVQTTG
jgi:prepilin-type N-terminal cleavage/methylation domain-containing protein